MSEHLPILILAKLSYNNDNIKDQITIFDKCRLKEEMIANAKKNHNCACGPKNSMELIESFHNNLGKILRDLKVIRPP